MIDPFPRVFGAPDLSIADGSAVSANLGVNPSLTITAMSERAASFWPNRGEPDPGPPVGEPYRRIDPVRPARPAVPAHRPRFALEIALPLVDGREPGSDDALVRRTVLTTGASSGIGLATAIAVARAGFRSVGTVRSEAKAETLRAAAHEAGVEVQPVLLDVTDAGGCERVIEGAQPWGLVNNAGYGSNGAVEDVSDEEARQMLETMVVAPMRLVRLALPHMREQGGGRIVNVSSIYGRTTTPLTGWYQGAKHALEGLSDALRAEVASSGVRVVVVEPGTVRTGIWNEVERTTSARQGSRYEGAYRRSLESVHLVEPLMGDPTECADVIVKALTHWMPSPRYLVGNDARLLALTDPFLPTAVKDWVARLTLGL